MNTQQSGTCLLGDNGNAAIGVMTHEERDYWAREAALEMVDCPNCQGRRVVTRPYIAGVVNVSHPCSWCEGTGSCTRATAGEWEESLR